MWRGLMARIIESGEADYEAREIPFGKIYEWHPAYVTIRCDCGEETILAASGTSATCRCGADLGAFVRDLKEPQGRPLDRAAHPWFYDAEAPAQQRLRHETAYPKGSSWRYDDITDDEG